LKKLGRCLIASMVLAAFWGSAHGAAAPASKGLKPAPSAPTEGSKTYLVLGAGLDLPGDNWQAAYDLGFGGRVGLGFRIGKDLDLELALENFNFSGTNLAGDISLIDLRLLPTLRWRLGGDGIRPYLTAALGVDTQLLFSPTLSNVPFYLDGAVGAGLEFKISPRDHFFLEGRYNLIFADNATGTDIPLLAGFRFGLDGGPSSEPTILTVEIKAEGTVISGFESANHKFAFRDKDLAIFDKIAETLRKDPKKKLLITGHTDNVGSWGDNRWLSQNRALWVERFLLKHGVPKGSILRTEGLSYKEPVADNATETGRSDNRRVVIKIVEEKKTGN